LVLTRGEIIDRVNELVVVPATRTIRGLPSEVILGQSDGMPSACVLNFDHVSLAQRARLGTLLCELPEEKWPEVRRALLAACGFDESHDDVVTK